MGKQKIEVEGLNITIEENDYISITDIAKHSDTEPRHVIQNWLKNTNTIRYLYEWENIHNPKIKRMQMHALLEKGTNNRFTMSPSKWIELTNAIGLRTKNGRGGGTFAHKDIALNFIYWLDPVFQIYFIKEFQRLKEKEHKLLNNTLEFSLDKIIDEADKVRILAQLGKETLRGKLGEEE
jgi:hypothetical protein